ncbi:hypothetical protein [Streptomyces phage Verabelle]|uniref:Uncharacterized protein n=1 Tax=Streptomyces phage Verabelle TaxID=3065247 RepID=A0AA50F1B4_9CAUD|nr:hypothetical protein [Streptomyces phage Verabelle]
MAIEFWRVRWTDLQGKTHTSAVSYDRTLADKRLADLTLSGFEAEAFLYDPFNDKELSK